MATTPSPAAAAAASRPRPDAALALSVFGVVFAVYLASPVQQMADSHYALLISEALYRHRQVTVDRFLADDPARYPGILGVPMGATPGAGTIYPYQLERKSTGLHYRYGLGTSILSLPFVAAFNAAGISTIDAAGHYDLQAEARMQSVIAPAVAALAVALLFLAARSFLPPGPALLCAAAAAFASPLWSTASRALWSHTWGTALLSLAVLLVARAEAGGRARPVLLASTLAWAYFVRPTNAIAAAAIAGWALSRSRKETVRLVLVGATWLALFVGFTLATREEPIPLYYQGRRLLVTRFGEAMVGHLFSASRGMLVTTPLLAFVAWLAAGHARGLAARRIVLLVGGITIPHLLVLAAMRRWWAGWAFSSRVATELVPWFVLLGAFSLAGLLAKPTGGATGRRGQKVVGVLLLAWGVLCHGTGALSKATWDWNALPWPVDSDLQRVWDWRTSQVLAPLQARGDPAPAPALIEGQRWPALEAARAGMLARGWRIEGERAWMEDRSAVLRFDLHPEAPGSTDVPRVLRLAIATAGPVTLGLRVDGEVLEDLVVRAGRQYLALVLPGRARTGAVVVYLEAPWPRALVLDALTLGP